MKFTFTFITLFLLVATTKAQDTKAMLQQRWNFIGIEEFSVLHRPDSARANDWLQLNEDGTYEWNQSGKQTNGTWKMNETARTIVFTDGKTKKSITYNLKGISASDLTIEYQSPDLVRTRYRYQSVKK